MHCDVEIISVEIWLAVSTPLKNLSLSVGMMTFPIYGKIKAMLQTTNQKLPYNLCFRLAWGYLQFNPAKSQSNDATNVPAPKTSLQFHLSNGNPRYPPQIKTDRQYTYIHIIHIYNIYIYIYIIIIYIIIIYIYTHYILYIYTSRFPQRSCLVFSVSRGSVMKIQRPSSCFTMSCLPFF